MPEGIGCSIEIAQGIDEVSFSNVYVLLLFPLATGQQGTMKVQSRTADAEYCHFPCACSGFPRISSHLVPMD